MVCSQISRPGTPISLPPGIPAALAPGAPHSLPVLALLQSHSLAKRSWQRPQDQMETAFIPGARRGTKAPHHLRPSHKSCRGFWGEAKNTPLALIKEETPQGHHIPSGLAPAQELDSGWKRRADSLGTCPGPWGRGGVLVPVGKKETLAPGRDALISGRGRWGCPGPRNREIGRPGFGVVGGYVLAPGGTWSFKEAFAHFYRLSPP